MFCDQIHLDPPLLHEIWQDAANWTFGCQSLDRWCYRIARRYLLYTWLILRYFEEILGNALTLWRLGVSATMKLIEKVEWLVRERLKGTKLSASMILQETIWRLVQKPPFWIRLVNIVDIIHSLREKDRNIIILTICKTSQPFPVRKGRVDRSLNQQAISREAFYLYVWSLQELFRRRALDSQVCRFEILNMVTFSIWSNLGNFGSVYAAASLMP